MCPQMTASRTACRSAQSVFLYTHTTSCTDDESADSAHIEQISLTLLALESLRAIERRKKKANFTFTFNAWSRSRWRILHQRPGLAADSFLTEHQFRQTFRMTSGKLEERLMILGPAFCPKVKEKMKRGRAKTYTAVLSARVKVLISILLLGGGSYLDLRMVHGVSTTTLYSVFSQVFCYISSCVEERFRLVISKNTSATCDERPRVPEFDRKSLRTIQMCRGARRPGDKR